jgi:hypothetical protein
VAADPGYWHQQQMERVINRGIQVVIPPDSGRRRGTRPGWEKGLYAFMRQVLSTEHGQEDLQVVETIVRDKWVPVEHLEEYRPSEVCQMVEERTRLRFSMTDHTKAWRHYKVSRPAAPAILSGRMRATASGTGPTATTFPPRPG